MYKKYFIKDKKHLCCIICNWKCSVFKFSELEYVQLKKQINNSSEEMQISQNIVHSLCLQNHLKKFHSNIYDVNELSNENLEDLGKQILNKLQIRSNQYKKLSPKQRWKILPILMLIAEKKCFPIKLKLNCCNCIICQDDYTFSNIYVKRKKQLNDIIKLNETISMNNFKLFDDNSEPIISKKNYNNNRKKINVEEYGLNSYIVRYDKKLFFIMKRKFLIYNKHLKGGGGWLIPKSRLKVWKTFVNQKGYEVVLTRSNQISIKKEYIEENSITTSQDVQKQQLFNSKIDNNCSKNKLQEPNNYSLSMSEEISRKRNCHQIIKKSRKNSIVISKSVSPILNDSIIEINIENTKKEFSKVQNDNSWERIQNIIVNEKNKPFLISLDIETTIKRNIIEFGAIISDLKTMKELGVYETLVKSSGITAFSRSINHISIEMVKNAPTFNDISKILFSLLDGNVWLGHNIKAFDAKIIEKEFQKRNLISPKPIKIIDTLTIARKTIKNKVMNLKLNTLMNIYKLGKEKHRALSDARMTLQIFSKLTSIIYLNNI